MKTEAELLVSGIPHSIRSAKAIRSITDRMVASGVAECIERNGELVELLRIACSQRRITNKVGMVSRERAQRWVDRGLDAANRRYGSGRKIDRGVFYSRRQLCQQCNHHVEGCEKKGKRDGCQLLTNPCGVELLWLSAEEDWCPAGKQVSTESHDHRYFNSDPASFLRIELPPEELPEPSKPLAIVTHSTGVTYDRCREISRESVIAYAERIGADFIELEGDLFPTWKLANKFRAANVARLYDRTLWLDVDVIVSSDAPSIFEQTPRDDFAIYDEMACSAKQSVPGWETKQTKLICESQGFSQVDLQWSGNGGIFVIPRAFANIYDPPSEPIPSHWCAEQQLLTARLHAFGVPVHLLDWKWNCLRTGNYWHRRKEAHFVHFNGVFGKQLVKEMERYVAGEL